MASICPVLIQITAFQWRKCQKKTNTNLKLCASALEMDQEEGSGQGLGVDSLEEPLYLLCGE